MSDTVPFTDIPRAESIPDNQPQYLESVRTLQVGFGSRVLRADEQGLWMGAAEFADAPFSVDMDGNLVANSVTLSGYIAVGGALSDIGSGNITSTFIGSSAITSSKIASNAVIASKIDVDELSAISADIGSITSGTVTGALIRTSSTGDRVEIDDTSDSIKIYDGNDLRMELLENRMTFFDNGSNDVLSMFASDTGNFLMAGTASNDLLFSSERDIILSAADDFTVLATDIATIQANDQVELDTDSIARDIFLGLGSNTFIQLGDARVYFDVPIDMEGNDINDADDIRCVTLTETSDIRYKKNVVDLPYGLAEVLQLKPIKFRFKKQDRTKKAWRKARKHNKKKRRNNEKLPDIQGDKSRIDHLGFSAQDVHKLMPELTSNDGKGEERARLYSTQMIPVLVQAIQELNEKVESMK